MEYMYVLVHIDRLAFMDICDRLAAKFTPLEVENIVDKKNKIKRFVIL